MALNSDVEAIRLSAGWTDRTLLTVMEDFIAEKCDWHTFIEYLTQRELDEEPETNDDEES